jgi:cytochrome P450
MVRIACMAEVGVVETAEKNLTSLPLPPKNPLPYLQRARALRSFHTGMDQLRDAGGPVTRFRLGPKWLMPPIVVATSPEAIRDILSYRDGAVDKTTRVFTEFRRIISANLFDPPYEPWLPRRRTLQPVLTKQQVRQFGGHMAEAAEAVAAGWRDGATVNLDAECRTLTLRALGRSVPGLDLTGHVADLTEPVRVALRYVANRAARPMRAPVEAGTALVFGRPAVQRDPTLWEDPLKFDPDRFSEENVKSRDRWQCVPFGGGPRSCIGDHFAMLEATLGLATFIRHAEFCSLDDEFPLAAPFTMVADGPIWARICRRGGPQRK